MVGAEMLQVKVRGNADLFISIHFRKADKRSAPGAINSSIHVWSLRFFALVTGNCRGEESWFV